MATPRTPTARKAGPAFRCTECGQESAKWLGRCSECQAWGTVTEAGPGASRSGMAVRLTAGPVSSPALRISDVPLDPARAMPTGIDELDRVLGGGLVPGSVVLLAGEPGVGKSTLLLEVAARFASPTTPVLVVSGEESAAQVRLRAERTESLDPHLWLAAETDLAALLGHVDAVQPALLVVDSVQTIATADVDGSAGGVSQIREVSAALTRVAKERNIAVLLVGHVTKEGSIAGPRLLEHIVDVVLHFEGERHSALRLVRGIKNRYGPADEVGCFEMHEGGISGVSDPSGLFLSERRTAVPGTCVTVAMEGKRPLVAEVQALIGGEGSQNPRRGVSGLDSARFQMLLAVVQKSFNLKLSAADVYAATIGGVRITEPAVDLAVAVAVASAAGNLAVPREVVAIGEVGLSGDIRPVTGLGQRLAEAARLGFRLALVPPHPSASRAPRPSAPSGLEVWEVADLGAAWATVRRASRAT